MRKCDIISYLYQLIIGFYWVLLVSLYYLKKRGRKKKKKKNQLLTARSWPGTVSQALVLLQAAWHSQVMNNFK